MYSLIDRTYARSLLDYGAGSGSLRIALRQTRPHQELDIAEYDPARATKATMPEGTYGVVTCIDVMEHVEEDCIDAVLDEIRDKTAHAAYFLISLTPAVHALPDGRNAHITIKPQAWWEEKLQARFERVDILRSKSTWFTCECYPR